MNMRSRFAAILTVALVAGTLAVPAAQASRMIESTVTGRVSEIRSGDTIVVNGRSYRVQAGSHAARTLDRVHAGQIVDLVLNGDPSSDAARVIVINVHEQP